MVGRRDVFHMSQKYDSLPGLKAEAVAVVVFPWIERLRDDARNDASSEYERGLRPGDLRGEGKREEKGGDDGLRVLSIHASPRMSGREILREPCLRVCYGRQLIIPTY